MFALVAHRESTTNRELAACRPGAATLTPAEALAVLRPGEVALGRLDVRPTLDGVESGLWALGALAERGVRLLNPPSALLTAHDKLLTARALARAGLPHPPTRVVFRGAHVDARGPVVVKPRYGSWGRDVVLCRDARELVRTLESLAGRPWFARQGALVQQLVPPRGFDLRLVVAAGTVVGAIERRAAPGEWRTNVALGGTRTPVVPPADACRLAVAAAAAAGADLVGVDLLPADGGWVVLELNGAAVFARARVRARARRVRGGNRRTRGSPRRATRRCRALSSNTTAACSAASSPSACSRSSRPARRPRTARWSSRAPRRR
jgi:RimK family alpha-L-glutamate ligase